MPQSFSQVFQQEKNAILKELAAKFLKNKYGKTVESFFSGTCENKIINVSKGNWLGVEIECVSPVSPKKVESDLAGIPGVSVKTDDSIKPGSKFGVEIAVAFMKDFPGSLQAVCAYLEETKVSTNKSCGLHVHLDCRDVDKSGAFSRADCLKSNIHSLKAFVDKSRWYNNFCAVSNNDHDWKDTRFRAVNYLAYDKFKTVEVRLHQSTIDFDTIYNWCMLLYATSRMNCVAKNVKVFSSSMPMLISKHFKNADMQKVKNYLESASKTKAEKTAESSATTDKQQPHVRMGIATDAPEDEPEAATEPEGPGPWSNVLKMPGGKVRVYIGKNEYYEYTEKA